MNNKQNSEVIYSITLEDIQNEAIKWIGRKLTDDELYTAKKGIESGLSFDIDTVMKTAINDAVIKNRKIKLRFMN